MRNPNNRKTLERLFILGAGASLSASEVATKDGSTSVYQAPLDSEFPTRIANIDLKRPNWVANAANTVTTKFRPDGGFTSYPLEEGILRQISLLQFFRSIHPRRSRAQIDEGTWLNLLSHLICVVLRRTRENAYGTYSKLVEKRFPSDVAVDQLPDRIVSFNYDTLLDNILLADREATDVYFDEIRQRRDRPSDASQENPILLKLHGSINWRCNEKDFKQIIAGSMSKNEPYQVPAIWLDRSRPPSPQDEASPLIIPPLPTKPITAVGIFKWLWTRAYEYLYEAKELIVIGYSLPKTDQLADSMFGAFRPQRMKRVVIVDPSTTTLDRWRQVLKRSGLGELRWTYYESLRHYIEWECGE